MNIEQIKEKLKSEEYDFLRTDPHLGNNIILLGLGGSHAYGTNIETSDLDVRGCAVNSKIEILTNMNFEQCCNEATEIYMDVTLSHYPLRDYKSMWSEMNNIVKDYAKMGKRNKNAIEHGKLAKHMMHLIRLYLMVIDILEKKEIITYRENDHDFLMEIRNGKYLDANRQPTEEFFSIVENLQKRFEYAKQNTDLPDNPDYKRINEFMVSVNERVVRGEI